MYPRQLRPLTVLLAALALAPSAGEAQGSLLRRAKEKLKEKVTSTVLGPSSGGAAAAASRPGAAVLEMTPDVLDRLGRALAAESAMRAERERRQAEETAASLKYAACTDALVETAEYKAAEKKVLEPWTLGEPRDKQQKAKEALDRLVEERCGPLRDGTFDLPESEDAGAQAGGFSEREYSVLKERIPPFCKAAGSGVPKTTGKYVYSDAEREALHPRCGALMALLAGML